MGKFSEMHIAIQDELINIAHLAGEGELSNLDALIEMRNHRSEFEKSLALIKGFEDDNINFIANEASQYPLGYKGYEIKMVSGRKTFSFKNIPDWIAAEENKKAIEEQYRLMFEAKIKGLPHANISADGEELPLPEINYGKSFLTLKAKR